DTIRPHHPDVVVVMIGANDVTSRTRPSEAVQHLGRAVRRLRAEGAEVVVCTCPDLGTVEPILQPLRLVARVWSRQLAAAQTIAVVEAGGRTVSLGDVLGPEFAARPNEMFSADRFHPSAAGYAAAVAVTLPSVCAAVGLWPEETDAVTDRRLFSLADASPVASAAARAAGGPCCAAAALARSPTRCPPRRRYDPAAPPQPSARSVGIAAGAAGLDCRLGHGPPGWPAHPGPDTRRSRSVT
ncbi:MAG TPA: GDSL-type esterase/lipase family protein, partial [Mycobacteriales bacterium]|nr:GDSL-type esterase/lipase family protein [Mycobacteriales bacterium]